MMRFLYDLCHMLPLNLVAALSFLTYLGRQEDSLGAVLQEFWLFYLCWLWGIPARRSVS